MNPFKMLFKMPEVITGAMAAGDKVIFTAEEKKDFILESAKVLGPQTVARRWIAVGVTFMWVLGTVVCAGLIIFDHAQLNAFLELYTKIALVFGAILTFYFGAHLRRNWHVMEKKDG